MMHGKSNVKKKNPEDVDILLFLLLRWLTKHPLTQPTQNIV